jgi:2-polyprenyl-6-methoxyphenol hydroxylase-like FAD-dependent oxidoreductase
MGDAAHAIHPLAGQGVNLGFADARLLSGLLAECSPLHSIGDLSLLRKYERGRKESVMALATLTDQLKALFAHPAKSLAGLRNAGLAFADKQAWLKRRLMHYAMQ